MSDGTSTQVKVQMVNKCKALINLRRLYKRRKSPWRRDRKIYRKRERERERERLKNSVIRVRDALIRLLGHTNMGPMCAPSTVKSHPRQTWVVGWASHSGKEENVRRPGRSHNYRIKCKETTFSAALMWRGQANSVTLASVTHRKIRWMSDGTGTQVKVQMVNKCKALINLWRLYKRRKFPWRRDRKIYRKRERERER